MQQDTWTIREIRDDGSVEVATDVSHNDALRAIRVAMYGDADVLSAAWTDAVHELPLAA
jgi:hypothetical protein